MRESKQQLGSFLGVFIPTFIPIIGVIFFLRLGYIVGSAGVLTTLLIVLLAVSVTASTGLSLGSITTNIRIGRGGVYSIIRKTLGLEVGGAIGISVYLAQVFSAALYIFGFSELWMMTFTHHEPTAVLTGAFLSLLILIGAYRLVSKVQFIVFSVLCLGLLSALIGMNYAGGIQASLTTNITATGFWNLFALFFPGVTGIMAGIALSGKLKDPKHDIPHGLLAAIGITTVLYITFVFWLGNVASSAELITNTGIFFTQAIIPEIVIIGVIAALFTSGLITIIAAPQLLAEMANNRVVPRYFSAHKNDQPLRAIILTAVLVGIILFAGSLDAVAPILTMFFLLAYATINFCVYLEKSLGSVSFRPTLKIPGAISLYGAIASIVFMIMINAFAAIIALGLLVVTYIVLVRQELESKEGDARSGLFREIARWAAERVNNLPEGNKHNWKPSILLPVLTTRTLLGNFPVIKSIAYPNGTMTVLGLGLTGKSSTPEAQEISKQASKKELEELPSLVRKFGEEHLFTNYASVEVNNYTNGICVALESIESQVFHPNLLYLSFPPKDLPKYDLEKIFLTAQRTRVGVIMLDRDAELGLGSEQDIHVWIPENALKNEFYSERSFDLAMILAYRLYTNWDGTLNVHLATTPRKAKQAENYVKKLLYEARLPQETKIEIHTKELHEAIKEAPNSDIHIMPVDVKNLDELAKLSAHNKTWLYVADGGDEDILA